MIQSVSTTEDKTEYLRRLSGKPYFESTLGTHLHLFGNHPASGWAFYLLPGSAVLELRGGSAVLCGALPGGEAGEDAREELMGFLRFLHADTLRTEHPLTLPGWQPAAPLTLWELPKGRALPLPPAPPAELVPDKAPSMLPVSRLVICRERRRGRRVLLRGLHGAGPRGGHLPRAAAQRQTHLHGGLLRAERYRELYGRGRDRPRVAGQGAGAVFDCRAGE